MALESTEAIQVERLPEAVVLNSPAAVSRDSIPVPESPFDLDAFLADLQRDLISRALKQCDGNQTVAAQRLMLTKPSLRHKIQSLGIDAASFRRGGAPAE